MSECLNESCFYICILHEVKSLQHLHLLFSNNKCKNKRRNVRTDVKEIKEITRNGYKQLYANKLEYLEKIDKFLETDN